MTAANETPRSARPAATGASAGGGPVAPSAVRPFLIRRTSQGLITLLAASVLVFLAVSVLPGSPAAAVLGRHAKPALLARIDHQLGYDRPVPERYLDWLSELAQGDLGQSSIGLAQGKQSAPVWPLVRPRLVNTAILAAITIALLIPLSLFLGVMAGVSAGRWRDQVISTTALIFTALPEFVVGSLVIVVFFVWLDLLPPVSLVEPGETPLAHPDILVLPVLTLLGVSVAATARLVRVGTIEVLRSAYVETARLAGISERRVLRRYVLRNALAPSVQIFAISIQYLFGGVIVTEAVFGYPGLGSELVSAVSSHDNTVVLAIAVILAAIYISINVIADLLVILLVPKLRTQG